jgi:putative membrane protein
MKARSALVVAALLGVLLPVAPAASAEPAPRADVSPQDREYLNRTHQDNLFEIVAGNLADRGSCARVRELGREFVAHHTELDAELIAVAARDAVTLYSVPDPGELAQIADLAARSGPDFDAAWLRDQIAAHLQAVALGERETRYGWSPEVKALADRSAPVLRHHLQEAVTALGTCTPG